MYELDEKTFHTTLEVILNAFLQPVGVISAHQIYLAFQKVFMDSQILLQLWSPWA